MKYLLLVYGDKDRFDAMTSGEREVFRSSCRMHNEQLRQSGYLLATEMLDGSNRLIVQVENGKTAVSGGAIPRLQAHLTVLYVINARDLNKAIHVASQMPQAQSGWVEVWSVIEAD